MKQLLRPGAIAVLLLAAAAAQSGGSAEVQLKAAMHKELVDGDLNAAIDQYRKLLKRSGLNRADAAQVLLHLGQCYEKQGNAEARKSYEQLIRDYGDQKTVVVEARGRLATLGGHRASAAGFTARQVWTGSEVDTSGGLSLDGRFLAYVHWDTGDLAIRDLVNNTNRILTHEGRRTKPLANADTSCISPDGKQIAYTWEAENLIQLRVINSDGTGLRVVRALGQDESWLNPWAWSADQKFLLATIHQDRSREKKIAWIAVSDGKTRELKSYEMRVRGRPVLSPDSRYVAFNQYADSRRNDRDIYILSIADGRETMLMNDSADEYVLGWSPDGRYVLFATDRLGVDSIYWIPVSAGKVQGPPQLVRSNVGKVNPLGLTRSGAFYYSGDDGAVTSAETYTAGLDPATGKVVTKPGLAAETFSGANSSAFFSPDGLWLAYRHGWPDKRPDLVLKSLQSGESRILHPKLEGWATRGWHPDGKSVLIQGRPDMRKLEGQGAYSLDVSTGDVKPIAVNTGKLLALPVWSPDGRALIYEIGRTVFVREVATGHERPIYRAPSSIRRIAVSGNGDQVAIADLRSVVLVPFLGGDSRELLRLPERESLVTYPIAWMPDSRNLVFIKNRAGKTELWRVSVETGQTDDLGFRMDDLDYITVSPDGRRIAFNIVAKSKEEVWAMENFLPAR